VSWMRVVILGYGVEGSGLKGCVSIGKQNCFDPVSMATRLISVAAAIISSVVISTVVSTVVVAFIIAAIVVAHVLAFVV
jgi:hypothetical protein